MVKELKHIIGNRLLPLVVGLVWCVVPAHGKASSGEILEVGRFSGAAEGTEFPGGWKPLTFKKIPRHTSYQLVRDDQTVVVKAVSQASSSGLTNEIMINPKEYPIVRWRWKITNVITKSDVTKKDGDDYPARLYITFEYDSAKVGLLDKAKYETARLLYGHYPPLGALNYIWGRKEPKGMVVPNPYTDRAMMIVVENDTGQLNAWIEEERNVYEDYKSAFGEEPPMISGVAIMTDTDNTGESTTAYYGDIVFRSAK